MTDVHTIYITCELACAENEELCKPPATKRGSASALFYLGAAELTVRSGALGLRAQPSRFRQCHWEVHIQLLAQILAKAELSALPNSVAELSTLSRNIRGTCGE